MRERFEDLLARRDEVAALLADPAVQAEQGRYVVLAREYAATEEVAAVARELLDVLADLEAAAELLADDGARAPPLPRRPVGGQSYPTGPRQAEPRARQ